VNFRAAWVLLLFAQVFGCSEVKPPPPAAILQKDDLPPDEELRRQLDEVIDFTYQDRRLNTQDHAAWQILHGALAYQRDFQVRLDRDGPLVSAVDHLLEGGYINGWNARPGDVLDPATGRRGLRAILEPGSKSGQGHADQWLAVLAQCGLAPDQPIKVGGETYTMSDFVAQVQHDVSSNVDREWSWTLIGLTSYLPTNAEWTAADSELWSIERLVQAEAEQNLASSACGGSHRLIGLAMALNQHLDQGGELTGAWSEADEVIQAAIGTAREYQNPSGAFSINYFDRPGNSADLAQALSTTGHTLEFLALAMTDEQLQQLWVKRAALHLCDLFRKTRDLPLECGALYHATHGLVLYRQRLFGERPVAGR
jgi:hypothetical protein